MPYRLRLFSLKPNKNMRQTRGTIPLYSAIYPTKIIRRLTFRQAQDAVDSKEFRPYYRGKGKMRELCAVGMLHPLREDSGSPSGITANESAANAGLFGNSKTARMSEEQRKVLAGIGKPEADFIEQTQQKVEFWQILGDDKAIRVVHPTTIRRAEVLAASEG